MEWLLPCLFLQRKTHNRFLYKYWILFHSICRLFLLVFFLAQYHSIFIWVMIEAATVRLQLSRACIYVHIQSPSLAQWALEIMKRSITTTTLQPIVSHKINHHECCGFSFLNFALQITTVCLAKDVFLDFCNNATALANHIHRTSHSWWILWWKMKWLLQW